MQSNDDVTSQPMQSERFRWLIQDNRILDIRCDADTSMEIAADYAMGHGEIDSLVVRGEYFLIRGWLRSVPIPHRLARLLFSRRWKSVTLHSCMPRHETGINEAVELFCQTLKDLFLACLIPFSVTVKLFAP